MKGTKEQGFDEAGYGLRKEKKNFPAEPLMMAH